MRNISSKQAFSLVELMISLIAISLISAAFAPVITKRLSNGAITLGTFGGSSAEGITCPSGYYIQYNQCAICPSGHFCNGTNKIPCMAGTYAMQGQTQCSECPDGYYSANGAGECSENTAKNCAEKSKTENACTQCSGDTVKAADGNCVDSAPLYSFKDASGADATDTQTEVSNDGKYWYIKIKSSGTLEFQSLPTNVVDVFLVGGGAGGRTSVNSCGAQAGGGGNTLTERNVIISAEVPYPITVGTGVGTTQCAQTTGKTTGAFGLYAYGGVNKASHSTCAFGESNCNVKYGEVGSSSNQQPNTGNGGNTGKASMSGVVIIRGELNSTTFSNNIPSYTYVDTNGADTTSANSALYIKGNYWYIKLADSGRILFNSLPSNFIDVFLVSGGAGGRTSVNSCGTAVAGGGNTLTERNLYITEGISYPITVGASVSTTACAQTTGKTTSAFGLYAHGGVNKSNHSTYAFGESAYTTKYGEVGTDSNQNSNTGNGGTTAKRGMNGVVILRGLMNSSADGTASKLPIYKYTNDDGADISSTNSALTTVTLNSNKYWYLKFTGSGNLTFENIDNLTSDKIDVFAVGSGAGGRTSVNSCGTAAAGGGNFSISESPITISANQVYPIVVGAAVGTASCNQKTGNTSSAFGVSADGGSGKTSHSVCLFNQTGCEAIYGNVGTDNNQNNNTGNGGTTAKGGMSGVVVVRGKL